MKSGRMRLAASAVAAAFLAALLVLAIGTRRSAGPRPGARGTSGGNVGVRS